MNGSARENTHHEKTDAADERIISFQLSFLNVVSLPSVDCIIMCRKDCGEAAAAAAEACNGRVICVCEP